MPKTETKVKYRCDDCEYTTDDETKMKSTAEIHHLWERIEGGSEVPAGECMKCGALMYEVREMLVLTGPGGDVHGVVVVSGVNEKEIEAVIEEASEKYDQNLTAIDADLYVVGVDALRKWLKKQNGGRE